MRALEYRGAGSPGLSAHAHLRSVLDASPFFRTLPDASRARIARACELRALAPGERYEGGFAIVAGGALQLALQLPGSRAATFAVIGTGSFFSVNTIVGACPPVDVCRAVGPTVLGHLGAARLRLLLRRDAALRAHVGPLIAARLNAVVSLCADLIGAPLQRRLARRLLAQASTAGDAPGARAMALPMSQSMLAEILGVSRSTLNEELGLLEQAGIVRRLYRRIVLRDLGRLRDIAGPEVPPL